MLMSRHHVCYWALSPSVYVENGEINARFHEGATGTELQICVPIFEVSDACGIDTRITQMKRNLDKVTEDDQHGTVHVVTFVTNPGKVAIFAMGNKDRLCGFIPSKSPALQGVVEEKEILADLAVGGQPCRLVSHEPKPPEIEFEDQEIKITGVTGMIPNGMIVVKLSDGDSMSCGTFEMTEGMDISILVERFKDEVRVYEGEVRARGHPSLGDKLLVSALHFVDQKSLAIIVTKSTVDVVGFHQQGPYINL
jgi:hypothetical protein